MAKIKYLFFAVLALLLLSTPGSAFEDTVERYNTNYTEMWDTGDRMTVSVINHPSDSNSNSVLKTVCTSSTISDRVTTYIRSRSPAFTNLFSFRIDRLYLHTTAPAYYSPYPFWVKLQLIDSSDNVFVSYTIKELECGDELRAGFDDTTPHLYELSRVGNDIFLFIDGVNNGLLATDTGGESYYIQISVYAQYGTNMLYLDDFSSGSCIGIKPEWNEILDSVSGTYKIDSYSAYSDSSYNIDLTCLIGPNTGLINTTDITGKGAIGYIDYDTSNVFGDNYGLYMIDLLRGGMVLSSTYLVYYQLSNPIEYPELLLLAGSNANTEIRDDDYNGGPISAGGEVYLTPATRESGYYNISYKLMETPYSLKSTINTIYGDPTGIIFTISELTMPYTVTLDGKALSINSTAATGLFYFNGSIADRDILRISSDVYEFDSDGNTTEGNLLVPLGINLTSSCNNLLSELVANGTAPISACFSGNDTYKNLSISAKTLGPSGNSIIISTNASNITASGPTLSGGTDPIGQTAGLSSWSYNLTDCTGFHIFSFSPDLTLTGIYGYIKDSTTQTPIKSATIKISNGSQSYYIYSDSNGMYYQSNGMSPGMYNVSVSKYGYEPISRTVSVTAGDTTRQDLFLDQTTGEGIYYAPHDVLFTVWEYWNSGTGLPGASYTVYNDEDIVKTGITDSEGSFVVEDMDTGTRYKIVITHNEQIFTEFYEPGASSYTIILNKENIIHEYYNNWLNLTYEESAGCVNVSYLSNEAISQTSLIATASNGTTVYSETLTTDSGNFTFSYPEGDYIISFTAVTASGLTASQSWTVSYSTSAQLFPSSYPAWLKNLLYVAIILIFLLAFGKARNDIACGSAAVLTSIGYYFNWLVCSFSFVILIWIISLGAVFVHYKRTKGTG